MYPLLMIGDQLPSVGVLQILLNRTLEGPKLVKDGRFGPKTKKAVEDFQRARALKVDGVVGKTTWPRLIAGTGFEVLDAVDITDPNAETLDVPDIRAVGGNPILMHPMCNGVAEVLRRIGQRIRQAKGPVVLIRFHGHGSRGAMSVSDGKGYVQQGKKRVYLGPASRTALVPQGLVELLPVVSNYLAQRSVFCSIELHGCQVGAGAEGALALRTFSLFFRMPVSAGILSQYSGGERTFRFEGPTRTAVAPSGFAPYSALAAWAAALPDLPPASPA